MQKCKHPIFLKSYILHSSLFTQRMAPMQLVVPNAVIAAVMMLAINWRIALHVSFFLSHFYKV